MAATGNQDASQQHVECGSLFTKGVWTEGMGRRGVVRGYEEYFEMSAWSGASPCWCKEKSSTVWCGSRALFRVERGAGRAKTAGKRRALFRGRFFSALGN